LGQIELAGHALAAHYWDVDMEGDAIIVEQIALVMKQKQEAA